MLLSGSVKNPTAKIFMSFLFCVPLFYVCYFNMFLCKNLVCWRVKKKNRTIRTKKHEDSGRRLWKTLRATFLWVFFFFCAINKVFIEVKRTKSWYCKFTLVTNCNVCNICKFSRGIKTYQETQLKTINTHWKTQEIYRAIANFIDLIKY